MPPDAHSAQSDRVLVHPLLGYISGMCSDEMAHTKIDRKVLKAKGLAHELEAERDRYREAIKQARDLVAEAYSDDEHDDSPGNMAFAVLNAALDQKQNSTEDQ